MSMSTSEHGTGVSDGVLNGLSDEYARIFGPKYSDLYRRHIAGRRLSHNMTLEEYRANPVILSFGTIPGPDVGIIEEISIPVDDGTASIPADVYYPTGFSKAQMERLPCYVNYHGGGWVIGGVGDDASFLRTVVQECRCIAVDVGYRTAPEHRFPVAMEDSCAAYRHVVEHAPSLSIDPTRIAVGGFSAGGQLAAVVSQKARDEEYTQAPCFQLLVIPVCDASAIDTDLNVAKDCPHSSWREHFHAPFLSHARMTWFYRYFLPEKVTSEVLRDPVLSPLRAKSLANLPPALVVPAEVDVLRDEGIAYARRLGQENEGFTELWLAKRVPHPFPHQTEATDVAKEFRRLAVARLREAFDGSLTGGRKFVSNVDV